MSKDLVKPEVVQSFNSAGLTGNFQAVNVNGFSGAAFKIRIINDSDVPVSVSFNGIDANDFVLEGTDLTLDFQNNNQPGNNKCVFPAGTIVYLAGGAGTGFIYVTAYSQEV